jgi:hypothetical protein
MSQSLNSSGVHFFTTNSPMRSEKGSACFHLTASLYFLPADRSDAPTACSSKCGCSARRRMKRWPTEPVAPSTPTIESVCYSPICISYSPHFFLGKFLLCEVNFSASIVVVSGIGEIESIEFTKFWYDAGGGVESATPADHGGLHARILNALICRMFCHKQHFSLPYQN